MTVRVRVIPCLDVADGRVVKGVNFVDLKDAGDPVEQARAYDAAGADELCFLDISASHEQRGTLMVAGIHDNARNMMERGGLVMAIGQENFFWSSDQAIIEAERRGCQFC